MPTQTHDFPPAFDDLTEKQQAILRHKADDPETTNTAIAEATDSNLSYVGEVLNEYGHLLPHRDDETMSNDTDTTPRIGDPLASKLTTADDVQHISERPHTSRDDPLTFRLSEDEYIAIVRGELPDSLAERATHRLLRQAFGPNLD